MASIFSFDISSSSPFTTMEYHAPPTLGKGKDAEKVSTRFPDGIIRSSVIVMTGYLANFSSSLLSRMQNDNPTSGTGQLQWGHQLNPTAGGEREVVRRRLDDEIIPALAKSKFDVGFYGKHEICPRFISVTSGFHKIKIQRMGNPQGAFLRNRGGKRHRKAKLSGHGMILAAI
jgi:hypothetical protein